MTTLTTLKESSTRQRIDITLRNLGWNTNEKSPSAMYLPRGLKPSLKIKLSRVGQIIFYMRLTPTIPSVSLRPRSRVVICRKH